MNNNDTQICGAHLVGSVPYDSSKEVFEKVSAHLGQHLQRIPDGETGERTNWVDWQLPLLVNNPNLELVSNEAYEYTQIKQLDLAEGGDRKNLQLGDIGYARVALESYAEFANLKAAGNIPAHCRFQVCLPTPLATTHLYVVPELQADFEVQYEQSVTKELQQILDGIPQQELAIQWDTAVEFALLEGVMPTYIEDTQAGILERLTRMGMLVPADVEMGYHLCYGDSQHKHFCEPADTRLLVNIANGVAAGLTRPLNWIHLPVPKDRDDDAYYQPLSSLTLPEETELYLGLVHITDGETGANNRIAAASKHVRNFGVATECGFGRRPRDTLEPLMSIHSTVSEPLK